jgi:hypothetical protein
MSRNTSRINPPNKPTAPAMPFINTAQVFLFYNVRHKNGNGYKEYYGYMNSSICKTNQSNRYAQT